MYNLNKKIIKINKSIFNYEILKMNNVNINSKMN